MWLNNPRRLWEASGTSGMKSCVNGGFNLSVLDGWWDEAYNGLNGWAIGAGEEYSPEETKYQDEVESRAIYDLLEQEIVPLFYNRSSDGLPRGWLKRMKQCMTTVCPIFNTGRMVSEYMENMYWPSIGRYRSLSSDELAGAAELSNWRSRARENWASVRVEHVEATGANPMRVGTALDVRATVHLGSLSPEDVEVQLFHGLLDSKGSIPEPSTLSMSCTEPTSNGGSTVFVGRIPCVTSGQHGFAVRVLPRHENLAHQFEPGLVCWG